VVFPCKSRASCVCFALADSSVLSLNVGGTIYATTADTVSGSPYLRALISSSWKTTRDQQGHIFIDRDGHMFASILYFLRNQELPDVTDWEGFLTEAAYFGIDFSPQVVLELPFKTDEVFTRRDPRGELKEFTESLGVGGSIQWKPDFVLEGSIIIPFGHSEVVKTLHKVKVFLRRWQSTFGKVDVSEVATLEFVLPATRRRLKNSHSPVRSGEAELSDSDISSLDGDNYSVLDDVTPSQVADWLRLTQLHAYADKFLELDIPGRDLHGLAEDGGRYNDIPNVFNSDADTLTFVRLLPLFRREVGAGFIIDAHERNTTFEVARLSLTDVGGGEGKVDLAGD
jgi:hypothetical protein